MIIGTHNTMSYRIPKTWWHYFIRFTAQCQNVNYKEQHEKYGAMHFDLRIFWDKNGDIEFRHGMISYDANDFHDILKYCEDNGIICRILFEERKYTKNLRNRTKKLNLRQRFIDTCSMIEDMYPNLKCYGGQNTGDFKDVLYTFKNKYKVIDRYASTTSLFKSENTFLKKIDDLYPRLYAILKNKKNKEEFVIDGKDDELLLIDFINK